MAALTLTNDSNPEPTAKVQDRPLTAQIYPKPIVELSIPVGR